MGEVCRLYDVIYPRFLRGNLPGPVPGFRSDDDKAVAAETAEASVEVFMQRLDAQERVKRYRTAEALAALPSDGATIPEVVLVGQ